MEKAEKDILTTAQTAKLLGVSVRTAQVLIEGGSVPSWKTPGGHRRVYRADVEALIEGHASGVAPPSATVVVVAGAARLPLYDRLFRGVPECTAELFEHVHAALFAIGSVRPYAVLVDLDDGNSARLELLQSLAANPSLGHSHFLAVGNARAELSSERPERVIHVDAPAATVAWIRASFAEAGSLAVPSAGVPFPLALNERQRLVALERSGLLDTAPEEPFDQVAWLAAQSLDAPIALITLLTSTRHWFKARFGLDLPEAPRSGAFCNYTILQKGVFSVEDLRAIPASPPIRPLPASRAFDFTPELRSVDEEGFAIGSLCVIDRRQRALDERQERTLLALAGMASSEVRLRATERRLREALRREERQARSGAGAAAAEDPLSARPTLGQSDGPSIASGRTHSSNSSSLSRPSSTAACLRVVPSLCAFFATLAALS